MTRRVGISRSEPASIIVSQEIRGVPELVEQTRPLAGVEALIRAPLETRADELGESNQARVRLEAG